MIKYTARQSFDGTWFVLRVMEGTQNQEDWYMAGMSYLRKNGEFIDVRRVLASPSLNKDTDFKTKREIIGRLKKSVPSIKKDRYPSDRGCITYTSS